MESRLGVDLFERTNGGTRPTPAGRDFLLSATHTLAELDLALRRLHTRSRGENGRLAIGIYASLSTGNMYATLAEHHRKFPEVEVHTMDGDHGQLLCALINNAVEVVIMTSVRSGWDDRALPLWSERVMVALHERQPPRQQVTAQSHSAEPRRPSHTSCRERPQERANHGNPRKIVSRQSD